MARRASSSKNTPMVVGIIVLVAAFAFAAKFFLFKNKGSNLEGAKFSMQEFMENGNSLRGNEYVVEGVVDQKLAWINGDQAQVVSLKVEGSSGDLLGIEIPAEFNTLNIERNLKYGFKIKIREGGIPVAVKIERL